MQAEAKLQQAASDWTRAQQLLPKKAIADTDYDLATGQYESAVANVALCKAQIRQSQGVLDSARDQPRLHAELPRRLTASSPTERWIQGRLWLSTYQTPVLFMVAPELEKRVYVLAAVDEADIGYIRDAQAQKAARHLYRRGLSRRQVQGDDSPGPPQFDHGPEHRHVYGGG